MANITNFVCTGFEIANTGNGNISFSWVPPSGAWDYQITVTATGGFQIGPIVIFPSKTTYGENINYNARSTATLAGGGGGLSRGVTYTASIKYSTVLPNPGYTPAFSSTAVTTTFSLGAGTVGIVTIESLPEDPQGQLLLTMDNGGTTATTGTLSYGGSSYPITFDSTGQTGYNVNNLAPGALTAFTVTVAGATTATRSYYTPAVQHIYGTPTVGNTTFTLPWTNGAGSSVSASNVFTSVMLYNNSTDLWISTAVQAISGTTGTVTLTGLTKGDSYTLYVFPNNSSGASSPSGVDGPHYVEFIAGGSSTTASFGINGWFYSPIAV